LPLRYPPPSPTRRSSDLEAYQVLSNSETRELYDRYGHAGLRGGGFTPGTFDFGSLSDIFSAFFGDDLFGVGGTRRARGADIAAEDRKSTRLNSSHQIISY